MAMGHLDGTAGPVGEEAVRFWATEARAPTAARGQTPRAAMGMTVPTGARARMARRAATVVSPLVATEDPAGEVVTRPLPRATVARVELVAQEATAWEEMAETAEWVETVAVLRDLPGLGSSVA